MISNLEKHSEWLALMIGNSRLHWAYFQRKALKETWDTQHLLNPLVNQELPENILESRSFSLNIPLYIASVVPQQSEFFQAYTHAHIINLEQIPLARTYATMGSDRVLAVWGAGVTLGFPCLVIDAGTALTFTGVNDQQVLVGGAILPGLKLQLQSLANKTAALPQISLPNNLPNRWALDTPEAIESGVIYTVLAGIKDYIQDWFDQFPSSHIVLTGGDAKLLLGYLQEQFPTIAAKLILDANLIFWGMRSLVTNQWC